MRPLVRHWWGSVLNRGYLSKEAPTPHMRLSLVGDPEWPNKVSAEYLYALFLSEANVGNVPTSLASFTKILKEVSGLKSRHTYLGSRSMYRREAVGATKNTLLFRSVEELKKGFAGFPHQTN